MTDEEKQFIKRLLGRVAMQSALTYAATVVLVVFVNQWWVLPVAIGFTIGTLLVLIILAWSLWYV
jgi:hypothetical protein